MAGSAPTISVITAVRNDRRRFALTAEQRDRAARRDFEWIVVDGGSDDGTLDEIRRFEPWIAVWQSRPDRGVYDAMNPACCSRAATTSCS